MKKEIFNLSLETCLCFGVLSLRIAASTFEVIPINCNPNCLIIEISRHHRNGWILHISMHVA